MKKMNRLKYMSIWIFAIMIMVINKGTGQTTLPDELTKKSIIEQISYIEQHTRIYENYRAIREDMFQKIKSNFIDSLSADQSKISGLHIFTAALNHTIDSLDASLETTNITLKEITRTKNSISVFGLEINKLTYNTIMWTIIAGLIIVLTIGFLVFKRNQIVSTRTKKDLKELRDEFEAYRQASRIAREKMSMDHFNELKKLKGS
jgi:hypothetical protein